MIIYDLNGRNSLGRILINFYLKDINTSFIPGAPNLRNTCCDSYVHYLRDITVFERY